MILVLTLWNLQPSPDILDCGSDNSCDIEPLPKPSIPRPTTGNYHEEMKLENNFDDIPMVPNNIVEEIYKPKLPDILPESKVDYSVENKIVDLIPKFNSSIFEKKEDQLSANDLMPSTDNEWSNLNNFSTDIDHQNYLTSDKIGRFGVNTVGGTLRNALYDIRGAPEIPKLKIPFQNSTIDRDNNLKSFRIS